MYYNLINGETLVSISVEIKIAVHFSRIGNGEVSVEFIGRKRDKNKEG